MINIKGKKVYLHLCSMIKNEQDTISRMIDSWSVLPLDSIEIMDTGSADNTLKILDEYKKKINLSYFQKPFANFVQSKNDLMNYVYDKYASKVNDNNIHLVIFSDADEYIEKENKELILKAINKLVNNNAMYITTMINDIAGENPERVVLSYTRARIWRIKKSDNFLYEGPFVHEYIDTQNSIQVSATDVIVKHKHKQNKNYQGNFKMYVKLMSEYLVGYEGEDKTMDMRAYYYLASTYQSLRDFENAIQWFERYLSVYDDSGVIHPSERFNAALNLGMCYQQKGDYSKALEVFEQCNKKYKDREQRKEPYYYAVKILLDVPAMRDFDRAYKLLKEANSIQNIDKSRLMFYNTQINDIWLENLLKWIEIEKVKEDAKNRDGQIFNNYFDEVFLINLHRRKDRMQAVHKKLSSNGIKYTRIEGYDGRLFNFGVNPDINGQTTPGYIACNLTHTSIVQRAKDDGLKNFLVFEDDIRIINDVSNKFKISVTDMEKDGIEWDMLFLGYFLVSRKSENDWYFIHQKYDKSYVRLDEYNYLEDGRVLEIYGCHAVAFNERIYDVILDAYKDNLLENYDNLLFQLMRQGKLKNVYGCVPQLFVQDADTPSNTHHYTNFRFDTVNFVNKEYGVYEDYC